MDKIIIKLRSITIIFILAIILTACSSGGRSSMERRFQQIDKLCDSLPLKALQILDSINPDNLSEKDLNLYRLLWIKSRDKAYIVHETDTIILKVIDYYANHRSENLYPEALYYGGRVYSDLGDYPTALELFQKSLDEIPEDKTSLKFRSTVLNQTGRLLYTIHLDSTAIEYLEKSLEVNPDKATDNYNIAFTHGLLSGLYARQNNIVKARGHTNISLNLSSYLDESDRLTILSEFAEMLYEEQKIDSALTVIRPLPAIVDQATLSYCLAVASQIYNTAGIPDTAYMYARQLTRLPDLRNKETGYDVIFSDELRDFVPKDTLLKLMPEYVQTIEEFLRTHEAEQALIQNAQYNYNKHLRDSKVAEEKLRDLRENLWITACCVMLLFFILVILQLRNKYHKAKNDSQVMEGIILADKLKETTTEPIPEDSMKIPKINPDFKGIKDKILDDLKRNKEICQNTVISDIISESSVYKKLKGRIVDNMPIDTGISWSEIEEIVETASSGFSQRLAIITEGKITRSERKVVFLMKMGFTQVQMACLLSREPSTISNQRTSIARKIGLNKSLVTSMIFYL